MTKLNAYSIKGTKLKGISLPKNFTESKNMSLLAQAIRVYQNSTHLGLSKTKSRGEISLSTRKVWRQKGTGRARHGARSAPIFVGGSKAHGPKGMKRKLKLPKKMKQKALATALSLKAREGKVIAVDKISTIKKTKEAAGLIEKIVNKEKDIKEKSRFTICLTDNSNARLVFRNIKNTSIVRFNDLNAHDVYFGGTLIVDKDALVSTRKPLKKSKTEKGGNKK